MQSTGKFFWIAIGAAVVMLSLASAPPTANTITIEQVLARLARSDRAASNFCSDVTFTPYDANARVIGPEKSGLRCYAKPDISILCLSSTTGSQESHGEIGQSVRTEINGHAATKIIPDSFFLRDVRSTIAIHRGEAAFDGKTGQAHFLFEPGGKTATARNASGIYTIAIEAKNREKAVIRVDVNNGTVLEKTVFSLLTGKQVSRENHGDFTAVGAALLPGRTVYEYGGQRVVVQLRNYRVNVPLDIRRFAAGNAGCEDLAGTLARSLHSVGRQPPEPETISSDAGQAGPVRNHRQPSRARARHGTQGLSAN